MKYLPTDVNTFFTMITGNYIYIDKTEWIYNLFSGGTRYYFLARPRRFGKSLLISTLKEFFLGNKELFKDLKISKLNYQWKNYSVIHLDFSIISHKTTDELSINLSWALDEISKYYSVDISRAPSVSAKLVLLVNSLAEKNGPNSVVILIDEYDKPILDHLSDIEMAQAQRAVLRSFYDTLKGLDRYLRAIFITGVTKFSKTSIFSGLNNLNDISMTKESAQLLGYTQEEIESYFKERINVIAKQEDSNPEETLNKIRIWYNGYRFSDIDVKVYNPFSVLYFLHRQKFSNYWFESGTPNFLINLLKTQYSSLELKSEEVSFSSLSTFDIERIDLLPLLFQTGYLTIVNYNKQTDRFILGYPNLEVKEAFVNYLIATLTNTNRENVDKAVNSLIDALNNDNILLFCEILQSFFAQIPYSLHINKESYYHSLFQFLMTLLSVKSQSEILTDKGRIDIVLTSKTHIYIFELKINIDPKKALKQIEEKKYYERYFNSGKKIVLVGLVFKSGKQKLALDCVTKAL